MRASFNNGRVDPLLDWIVLVAMATYSGQSGLEGEVRAWCEVLQSTWWQLISIGRSRLNHPILTGPISLTSGNQNKLGTGTRLGKNR